MGCDPRVRVAAAIVPARRQRAATRRRQAAASISQVTSSSSAAREVVGTGVSAPPGPRPASGVLTHRASPAVQATGGVQLLVVQPAGVGGGSQAAPVQAAGAVMALTIWARPAGSGLATVKLTVTVALPPAGTLAKLTLHSVPAAASAAQVVLAPVLPSLTLAKRVPAGTTSLTV